MQRRNTINSNQFIQPCCQCQVNSEATDGAGDGARPLHNSKVCSHLTYNVASLWTTIEVCRGLYTSWWPAGRPKSPPHHICPDETARVRHKQPDRRQKDIKVWSSVPLFVKPLHRHPEQQHSFGEVGWEFKLTCLGHFGQQQHQSPALLVLLVSGLSAAIKEWEWNELGPVKWQMCQQINVYLFLSINLSCIEKLWFYAPVIAFFLHVQILNRNYDFS